MVVSALAFRTRLLTVRQAARVLNVHENTLRRWCDEGLLRSCRINARGDRRLSEDDVAALSVHMHGNHGYL